MKRTYIVVVTHTGSEASDFDRIFKDYMTSYSYPFLDDYGPGDQDQGRSDGYEGPYVTNVKVEVIG